jgi:hypothetical protein
MIINQMKLQYSQESCESAKYFTDYLRIIGRLIFEGKEPVLCKFNNM